MQLQLGREGKGEPEKNAHLFTLCLQFVKQMIWLFRTALRA